MPGVCTVKSLWCALSAKCIQIDETDFLHHNVDAIRRNLAPKANHQLPILWYSMALAVNSLLFLHSDDQVSTIVLWWNLCNVHRFFPECTSWTTQFERKCCIYAYKLVEKFYLSIIVTKHHMSALQLPKG